MQGFPPPTPDRMLRGMRLAASTVAYGHFKALEVSF